MALLDPFAWLRLPSPAQPYQVHPVLLTEAASVATSLLSERVGPLAQSIEAGIPKSVSLTFAFNHPLALSLSSCLCRRKGMTVSFMFYLLGRCLHFSLGLVPKEGQVLFVRSVFLLSCTSLYRGWSTPRGTMHYSPSRSTSNSIR